MIYLCICLFFEGRVLHLLHCIVSAAIVFHTKCRCYSNNDKRDSITYEVKPAKIKLKIKKVKHQFEHKVVWRIISVWISLLVTSI